jgi:hypothetical protein
MIYGIDGKFGSGKSSTATYLAHRASLEGTFIWTNIKMNSKRVKNYFYFEDDKFLDTLRTVNALNDLERTLFYKESKTSDLKQWQRSKFTKHIILFDEVGALANAKEHHKFAVEHIEYINQQRKNFTDMFLITADGEQTVKSLRRFCEQWMYVVPLTNMKSLSFFYNIKTVRIQKRDKDNKPEMEVFVGKDERGDYVKKERPLDFFYDWYYQPSVWDLYDDLHKNIADPAKYADLNVEAIKKSFELRPHLKAALDNIPELKERYKEPL